MDCYAKIKFGKREFLTKVDNNGGMTPLWNERFIFT